eukprot:scaffold104039_cov61-Phaeocystis_antarctica.AAC.5
METTMVTTLSDVAEVQLGAFSGTSLLDSAARSAACPSVGGIEARKVRRAERLLLLRGCCSASSDPRGISR